MNLNIILGSILAIILSFGSGFLAGDIHRGGVDEKNQAIAIAKANTEARAKEQKITIDHNEITKTTLGEKDAVEKNRILFNAQYSAAFGLRQSSTSLSSGSNSTLGIGSQTLRFSKADAEFLNNFAAECQVSAEERNEVILKYEALQ
jgi:23S rRNA G2445 N2-methylase RlmL